MKKGDKVEWMGCQLIATAVAKDGSWANFEIHNGAHMWTKRLRLPLPDKGVLIVPQYKGV